MRGTTAVSLLALIMTVAAARAETIKLHCTVQTTPKSEAEDYVVDTDDNTVTVILHDTIETKGMGKEEVPALKERVRRIIEEPVEAWLRASQTEGKSVTSDTIVENR